jgi:hypothetical protein
MPRRLSTLLNIVTKVSVIGKPAAKIGTIKAMPVEAFWNGANREFVANMKPNEYAPPSPK